MEFRPENIARFIRKNVVKRFGDVSRIFTGTPKTRFARFGEPLHAQSAHLVTKQKAHNMRHFFPIKKGAKKPYYIQYLPYLKKLFQRCRRCFFTQKAPPAYS